MINDSLRPNPVESPFVKAISVHPATVTTSKDSHGLYQDRFVAIIYLPTTYLSIQLIYFSTMNQAHGLH
jgi:hypothetical protein